MKQARRYWAGKAPDWVQEEEGAPPAAAAAAPAAPATAQAAAAAPPPGADPRLLRLTQRRSTSEAAVIRRRHVSPEPGEPLACREASPPCGAAAPQREQQQEEEREEDAEAIAARRMAIRARQLAAQEAAADSGSDVEGSEDSSEYTSDDDDDGDDDHGPVLLKPAFIPKMNRDTLAERDAVLAEAEQSTRQQAEKLEERRRQTQELVMQTQLQEAQQNQRTEAESEFDTSDEADEVEQYEAWRERELQRIARDRQLRHAGTKAEAAAAAPASAPPAAQMVAPKKKWKYLQKYWHKGAFFQSEGNDEDNVLGDVMYRDYSAPTGEDIFDKQMLPKIMQVRNFGRRGRTKWTHLLAEDTTMQAPDLV